MTQKGIKNPTKGNPNEFRWVEAYKVLRELIIKGEFTPGTKLVERKIATLIGVSRSSVRAAFHHLAAEGLIGLSPGKGAYIARMTSEDIMQVLEVREALEGMASSLAASRATNSQISEMKLAITEMRKGLKKKDYFHYLMHARSFHSKVYEAADNKFLHAAIDGARVMTIHYGVEILMTGYIDELFKGHERIFEAIQQGSSQLAERHSREHIQLLKEVFSILHKRKLLNKTVKYLHI